VNGCDVAIEVYREAGDVHKIVSTATRYDGVGVSIEPYAAALDYSYLLDSALDIYSSNSTATLTLMNTFYVTGDLDIGKTNQDFVLDLNGQTNFCASESDFVRTYFVGTYKRGKRQQSTPWD
jgi:hypothetical protein